MQLTNSIFNQYGESLSLRGAKPRSNSFVLFLSIILLAGNCSMVSGQERSAKVTKVEETIMGAYVPTAWGTHLVFSMPEKIIYAFDNTAPVNLRMQIYIPQCEYAQTIYPLTSAELKDRDDALNTLAKAPELKAARIKPADSSVPVREMKNTPPVSILKSSSALVTEELERLPVGYGMDDATLAANKLTLQSAYFSVWTSETKHIDAGTGNEVFFQWNRATNRDGKVLPISDDMYCVLKDADTGTILDIVRLGIMPDFAFALINNSPMVVPAGSTSVTDSIFSGRDLKMAYFIVSDVITCDYVDGDAARAGLRALRDFYNSNDGCGVGTAVAYAYNENVQGSAKALTVSNITWTPVAYGAQTTLNGTYYVIRIFYFSFDKDDWTMGTGYPLLAAGIDRTTFNNFPLKAPTGIEGTVYTDDKVLIMKDGSRVTVTDRNGNPASSIALYDLSGRLVNSVSASSIPIPCSCNQVYLIRVVIGGKSVTQLVVL